MGKWDNWCRTRGHNAACGCVYKIADPIIKAEAIKKGKRK